MFYVPCFFLTVIAVVAIDVIVAVAPDAVDFAVISYLLLSLCVSTLSSMPVSWVAFMFVMPVLPNLSISSVLFVLLF